MSTSSFLCFTYDSFKCSFFVYLYYLSGNLFNCLLKSLYTFVFEYYDVRSLDNMIFSIPNVLKDIRCTFDSIQSTKAIEKTNLQSNYLKKRPKSILSCLFLFAAVPKQVLNTANFTFLVSWEPSLLRLYITVCYK